MMMSIVNIAPNTRPYTGNYGYTYTGNYGYTYTGNYGYAFTGCYSYRYWIIFIMHKFSQMLHSDH